MSLTKWEKRWIKEAETQATYSKDPNTKIGCVLVHEWSKTRIASGYNGMPKKVDDNVPERSSRENGEKYFWYEHAERNAIYAAASEGVSTRGTTAFLSFGMPCTDCCRALIQSGIYKVVCKAGHPTGEPNEKWDAAAERSKTMFEEAGVRVRYYLEGDIYADA